jgi:hypothetical protein
MSLDRIYDAVWEALEEGVPIYEVSTVVDDAIMEWKYRDEE